MRSADPLAAARAIDHHPTFNAAKHIALLQDEDQEAMAITLGAVRDVFDVAEWSESTPGLTQEETIDLLDRFISYLDALKKNTSRLPTTSPSTELDSSDENRPPKSTPDSPSTETDKKCGEQASQP